MESLIIKTDGSISLCNPGNARRGFTLEELYKSLNCQTIEVVNATISSILPYKMKNPILICDEEGYLNSKDRNVLASIIARTTIVGDVIITESKNFK